MEKLHATYLDIKTMIDHTLQHTGQEYTLGKFTGLGWLFAPYSTQTYQTTLPYISLKQYDKSVNLYLQLDASLSQPLEDYASIFGKSAIGKGCLRLKNLTPERMETLQKLIEECYHQYNVKQQNPL